MRMLRSAKRLKPTASDLVEEMLADMAEDLVTRVIRRTEEGWKRLRLHDCTISGAGAQASGTCRGTLRYRPRVGDHSTRLRYGTWRFAMEREDGRWLIRRVTIS